MGPPPRKLLERVRETIQRKHYSIRTETAYVNWIKHYILFHKVKQGCARHPRVMGAPEIEAFLTHLAVNAQVAASTQNQAYSALLFLYREILQQELDGRVNALRAKKPKRLPKLAVMGRRRRFLNGW